MARLSGVWESVSRWIPVGVRAGAAYAGLVSVLLWPVLSGRRVLSTATDVYAWPPWASRVPSGLGGYLNPLLSDQTRSFYPWLFWAREQIHAGHLPQWNPLVLAGTPFLANGQSQMFSVFVVPIWLLPFNYALGVTAALKLLTAAAGTYLLAGRLGLGRWPRAVAGLAFGFSPFFGIWLYHPVSSVVALLPWGILFVERIADRGRGGDVAGLGIAVGVMNLGGYPEGQFQMSIGIVVYAVVRMAVLNGRGIRARAIRVGLVMFGVVLGAALAAFLLIPVAMSIPGTAGVANRVGGSGVEPLSALRTLLFPDWWGRPSGVNLGGPDNYNLRSFYAGAVPLLLATIAITNRCRWRIKLPFVVLTFLGFAVPLGLEPFRWIVLHTPLLDHSMNKLLVVFEQFGIAILAAVGLEEMLSDNQPTGRSIVVAGAGVTSAVTTAFALHPDSQVIHQVVRHFESGGTAKVASVLALVSICWWLLFASGFALLVGALRWMPRTVFAVACGLLVAADAAHFYHGYQPMPPARDVYPTPSAISFLQQHEGAWRVAALAPALPADIGMVYGLHDIRGLDPSQPSIAYARLIRLGIPSARLRANTTVEHLTPGSARVLDLLSVRYVITGLRRRFPGLPQFRAVYRGPDALVFQNTQALPRATIPSAVMRVRSDTSALALMASGGFQPGRNAVVEQQVPAGRGTVEIVGDSGEEIALRTSMARRGLVVLADQFSPGWTVTVDGKAAPAVRVDVALRGVVVGAGQHRVVWTYRTPGLTLGLLVSAGTLSLMTCWVIGWLLVSRRRSPFVEPRHPASAPNL
jgi:Bacterial membrane protein YfhO